MSMEERRGAAKEEEECNNDVLYVYFRAVTFTPILLIL